MNNKNFFLTFPLFLFYIFFFVIVKKAKKNERVEKIKHKI
jgi:hypothetical protein